jgi:hypothetical protein
MSQYNLDEVSPLVISTSVASNVLTLTASGTTLADWDWLRERIERAVEIENLLGRKARKTNG